MSEVHRRLYVSALWIIQGNLKRSPEHYFTYLERTFKMIQGESLVFFYETDHISERVTKTARDNNINLILEHLPITDHPDRQAAEVLTDRACNFQMDIWADEFPELLSVEKGFNQYYRFLRKGKNKTVYEKQLVCTLGKYSLIAKAIDTYPAKEYVWMDASASRFNQLRKRSDFTKIQLTSEKIFHYSSSQKVFGRNQEIQGSVLLGTMSAWIEFNKLYRQVMHDYIESQCNYPTTDEPLMTICKLRSPHLFVAINSKKRRISHKVAGYLLKPIRHQILKSMNYHMK